MKLLIIEDETKTVSYLRKGLAESGFVVDTSTDGDDGLYLARTGDYDLVLLDVMLPGRDGWSIVQELRRSGKDMPVIFLTARDAVPDRVKGLGLGADLEIDIVHRRVTRHGRRVDLTPQEFLLLSLLARRAGEVLGRMLIAEQVWDMNFDSDTNVVDVHVRRLRSKIDDPFEKKLLHTVRGSGYVLEDRGQRR